MRALLVFLTLCAVLTLGLWTTTQYEAQYIPAGIRGTPWATVAGYAIYQPHAWLRWYWQADHQTRQAMSGAIWICLRDLCRGDVRGGAGDEDRRKKKDAGDGYGSAVWGGMDDARRARLMTQTWASCWAVWTATT